MGEDFDEETAALLTKARSWSIMGGNPMRHVTLASAADLAAWADRLDAEARLPRLVRRLIHATAGGISHIGFPADESVRGPSYDGLLMAGRS
jgi:hypothetical protein